jgi:hypothetical protein
VFEGVVRHDRPRYGADDEPQQKSTDHCDPPTG